MIGMLLEHHAGRLPLWLSPVQVKILPIADRHLEYAQQVRQQLEAAQVRCELDERSERLPAKIRDAQLEQVPLMLIIGEQEAQNQTVSLRQREDKEQKTASVAEVIALIREQA